jgi:hypothetical protein
MFLGMSSPAVSSSRDEVLPSVLSQKDTLNTSAKRVRHHLQYRKFARVQCKGWSNHKTNRKAS